MNVRFKFKTKDEKCFKLKKEVTIKQAKEIFNERYKNDDNVVRVWLTYWGTWHEHDYKTLKDIIKKDKQ
jgi:hypothetical protein